MDIYEKNGIDISEIGTHSIRKEAVVYITVLVCTQGLPFLAYINIVYTKYKNAIDGIVGRTLVGIFPNIGEFGVSQYYLKHTLL